MRNREGYSYSVSSNFSAPVEGDAAVFSASAIANPANTPKVEASFLDELTQTLKDGFTAAELAAAKKALRDERIGGRSSDGGLLNLIAAREQYGRTLAWDEAIDAKLQALTLEQVNAAFRRHINPAQSPSSRAATSTGRRRISRFTCIVTWWDLREGIQGGWFARGTIAAAEKRSPNRMSLTVTRVPPCTDCSCQDGNRDQTRNARMFADSRAVATSGPFWFFGTVEGENVTPPDCHENVPVS